MGGAGRIVGIVVVILLIVAVPATAGNFVQDFFEGLAEFVRAVSN